jgi:D-sedoheptulose 7-phosphate isomerase
VKKVISKKKIVEDYLKGLRFCLDEISRQDIEGIVDIIFTAYEKGKQVFIMGNGGSATTACHFARDLQMLTAKEGKHRIKAFSLTDNIAMVTSLANDIDYSSIFKEQLVGRIGEGDVVIGISASGNSPNVLRAIEFARSQGAVTVGLIGFGGGKLREFIHKGIVLSSKDYGQVEDVHLVLDHIISYLVKEKIAGG